MLPHPRRNRDERDCYRRSCSAVQRVGLKQPADDQVRVRVVRVDGDEGGDFFCGRRVGGFSGARLSEQHDECAKRERNKLFLHF